MAKIKEFDRATIRVMDGHILKAIEEVASRFGVVCRFAGGTFDPTQYTAKLEMRIEGTDLRIVADFKELATIYGLDPSDLGKQFLDRGRPFTIIGLKPSSRRYPIVAEAESGKQYKFPAGTVKAGLPSKPEQVGVIDPA